MARVGLLTIGESPRPDGLASDVARVLGNDVTVVERGALDGLTAAEVADWAPAPGDDVLITLRSDGSDVRVAKAPLVERLQLRIDQLEEQDQVDVTVLMCTGAFPTFRHRKALLAPQGALYAVVLALAGPDGLVASVTPLTVQVEAARRKWREAGRPHTEVQVADPYGPDPAGAVAQAAAAARAAGAAVLFLDCFGYDLAMRAAARNEFGGPVVLARSMAARIAREVL